MTKAGHPIVRIMCMAVGSLLVLTGAGWLSWQSPAVQDTVYCWMVENLISADRGTRPDDVVVVAATAETTPERTSCDAADDAAVWVDPVDPSNSLIVGANKRESLSVFRLDGQRISERQTGGSNNVDVRGGISVGGRDRIIVGATSPRGSRIDLFELDSASGQLLDIAEAPIEHDAGGRDFRILLLPQRSGAAISSRSRRTSRDSSSSGGCTTTAAGRIRAELDPATAGRLRSRKAVWPTTPNGVLFVGEENVGIWRFNAEPGTPTPRAVLIARTGVEEANGRPHPGGRGRAGHLRAAARRTRRGLPGGLQPG